MYSYHRHSNIFFPSISWISRFRALRHCMNHAENLPIKRRGTIVHLPVKERKSEERAVHLNAPHAAHGISGVPREVRKTLCYVFT